MKKTIIILALLHLVGCAFAPPQAYPIFSMPTDEQAAKLVLGTNQNAAFGAFSTVQEGQERMQRQRLWYLQLAENSQRAVYNQSDWSLGGATLGTIGGLTKSVPTAAVGALLGGGTSMIASRYGLSAQTTAYLRAADKAGCVWAVLNSYSVAQQGSDSTSDWGSANASVIKEATLESMQVQSEVRTTLLSFTPAAVDPQKLVELYNKYNQLKGQLTQSLAAQQAKRVESGVTKQLLDKQRLDDSAASAATGAGEKEPLQQKEGQVQPAAEANGAARANPVVGPARRADGGARDNDLKALGDVTARELANGGRASARDVRGAVPVRVAGRTALPAEVGDGAARALSPASKQLLDAYTAQRMELSQLTTEYAEAQAKVTNADLQSCVATGKPVAEL